MRLSELNKNTLEDLKDKLQEGGIIQLSKEDLTNTANGMELFAYQQIIGNNIREVIKQEKEALKQISEIVRDELTRESLCYQLAAPEHLLFCEYQKVKNEFCAFSQLHQLWMMEGVVLNKGANDEVSLSIFYFQGIIDITNSNAKTQLDWTDLDIPSFLRPIEN